jgi:hypothetical protein
MKVKEAIIRGIAGVIFIICIIALSLKFAGTY